MGIAATLSARQINAAIYYQEDFEGTGGGAGWTNGDVLETAGAGPITWQKTTGASDSVEVTNTHGTLDGLAIDGSTQNQALESAAHDKVLLIRSLILEDLK